MNRADRPCTVVGCDDPRYVGSGGYVASRCQAHLNDSVRRRYRARVSLKPCRGPASWHDDMPSELFDEFMPYPEFFARTGVYESGTVPADVWIVPAAVPELPGNPCDAPRMARADGSLSLYCLFHSGMWESLYEERIGAASGAG